MLTRMFKVKTLIKNCEIKKDNSNINPISWRNEKFLNKLCIANGKKTYKGLDWYWLPFSVKRFKKFSAIE